MKNWMIICCVIGLSGCAAKGQVIPLPDGISEVKAGGYNAKSAMDSALKTAGETCQPKRFVVIDQKSGYYGKYSEETRDALNQRNAVLTAATNTYVGPVNGKADYQTTLRIKCE